MQKFPSIYIMSNKFNTTIYIGVTNNLLRRAWEHKNEIVEGFTEKYKLTKLIYYEFFDQMTEAIQREKQLKKWSRMKKNALIEKMNPIWVDLYDSLV